MRSKITSWNWLKRGKNLASKKRKLAEEAVLRVLMVLGECNFNVLKKQTGLNYYTLNKILVDLVARGVVAEKRVGRLRVIRLLSKL